MAKATFAPTGEQQQVIDHRGGHLQVIACAGAGKTEAISRRVCSLIEGGVEPGQIVAFTFTERAAESLKTRITRRIAEAKGDAFLDRLNPMYVGTIHAYCLRMLTDHVPEFGNFDILDENRLAGLLSREFKRLELNKLSDQHWRPIRDFLRNADVMENELIDPAAIKKTPFGQCYLAFKEMLFRYHFLSYGLLISAAVKALARPEVFARVHGPLRHLIVDEYQDINPAQEKLISLLAQKPVELCVVADDDQAIYQWRGSDVSHMQGFQKRYTATPLTLSENRRSRPAIIRMANDFAVSISPRLPKRMKPCRSAGGPETHAWAAETPEAEARVIAETIEKLHKDGYRYKDVAILYRSARTSSPPLLAELKERGIPFRCAGRTGLFLQPEPTVLGRTYAWLIDNEWKTERFAASEAVAIDDLVKEYHRLFNGGKKIADLRQYLEDWKGSVKKTFTSVNLVRDYYKLLNLLGVHGIDPDDSVGSARLGTLARFSQILADFEHVKRRSRYVEESGGRVFRCGQDRGEWFYRQLFNYLQYYALDAYEDFEGEDTFDLDAVDILTVHQAKGLEWPVVFLPALVTGRFPARMAGRPQDWLIPETIFTPDARQRYQGGEMEERRLFYVALTRARDMLYLSCFRKINNKFQPSPFLVEVAGNPKDQKKLPLPDTFTPPADEREDLPTITFSELAHYEGCPLRFRYSTSLGFQPQLVTELGYGRAIHHILRHVAEATIRAGKVPTAKQIDAIFEREFYLPFANTAAFLQLHDQARKLVDTYIAKHSDDLLRIWQTERPFELHLEAGIVSGRADVILDREGNTVGQLAIVDYKTANDARGDDIHGFQLAIYTAAGRGEGLNVKAAYLHALKESARRPVPVDNPAVKKARNRALTLIESIAEGEFPARPEKTKCTGCDMRAICKHAECSKYDL
jgi:DNA helicase-2/ATP-dependent DNA helicase PcrA